MISRVTRTFAANRLVVATGVLDLLVTIALIPVGIYPMHLIRMQPRSY